MNKSGKSFLLKLAIFVCPFVLVLLVEITLFPLDAFSFRVWEAVSVSESPWIRQFVPSMPFYPETRIEKTEFGDLGHHTRFARPKKVVWQTDAWGFRNSSTGDKPFDVVIVGDSFTAGSALTQRDTLAATLEREAGLKAYGYAPARLDQFLAETRFRTDPRPVVVYQLEERGFVWVIPYLEDVWPVDQDGVVIGDHRPGTVAKAWRAAVIGLDRFCKGALLLSKRARLRDAVAESVHTVVGVPYVRDQPVQGAVIGNDDQTLFRVGRLANRKISASIVNRAAERLKEFDRAVRESGFRFVVLPVPNKENIYHHLLEGADRPEFLDQVITAARAAGIETVDVQPAFRVAKDDGAKLYHLDDTHWNAEGVRVAAGVLADALKQPLHRASASR